MTIHTLFNDPWISLKKVTSSNPDIHDYIFSHESRCNGNIVAVLPFILTDNLDLKYLLKNDITPCWGEEQHLCVLTGGVESDSPLDDAMRELHEESGYLVTPDRVIQLGTCRGVKSNDSIYHLYAVDVTDISPDVPKGDGSWCEAHGESVWVDDVSIGVDPHAAMIALRLEMFFRTRTATM